MTEKDEFDTGLELDDNAPDAFDDAGFDDVGLEAEEAPVKAKKSGGGFFVKFLLLLVLLGGGLFASVKYLGVQLPFEVPFLSELAAGDKAPPQPVAANDPAPAPADTQPTAVVDAGNWDTPAPADGNVMIGDEAPAFDDSASATTGMADPADTGFGLPVTEDTSATTDNADIAAWPGLDDAATDTPVTDTMTTAADAEMAPPVMNDDTAMEDPFGTAKQDTVAVDTGTDAAPVTFDDAPDAKTAAVTTTTTAENAASAEEVAALEKKIADLEKTVQQLKTSTVRKDDVAGLKAALAKFEKPVATTPKKASTSKTDETATAAPVKTTAKKPVVRKTWVLRSAKPGMAWISEKNSSELKTVSVGDNVAGIGKVTAIAKDDTGRWVVNGTSGKINQ